jgi:oligopeptide transport system substrate-binding protein
VIALLLGACTREDGQAAGPTPTPTEAGDIGDEMNGIVETDDVFAAGERVLTVGIKEPATLDPMRVQDPGSVLVARQLFAGLTRWDAENEEVLPEVAEAWQVSRGGRRFVFKLRPGMTFHDGTPVTADDFRFAFNRIARKENASDLAYTLERVQGFVAVNQLGDANRLRGVGTRGDLELVIDLNEPFHDLPAVLTHPGLAPVPAHAVDDYDSFLQEPVGNGPFQMEEPWTGGPLYLRAFPGFVSTPSIDGIRMIPFEDAAASWVPFLRGELDAAEVPAGQLQAAAEAFGEVGFQPFLAGYYYGLNVEARPLRNIRVRRAINLAIDREEIAETVFKGTLTPPRGLVPEGMPGFHENICVEMCAHEPERAARIVSNLPRRARNITVEFTRGEPHGEVARMVKSDLEGAGFRVELERYPFARYLRRLRAGNQGMYRLGWIAEYPSADVFLSSLFESDSPDNHSGLSSPRIDRLLRRARAEASENRRHQLYVQAEKAIMRQVPIVPIGSFLTHWAVSPRVRGASFDVMGGFDALHVELADDD